jgi:hypothetical protein
LKLSKTEAVRLIKHEPYKLGSGLYKAEAYKQRFYSALLGRREPEGATGVPGKLQIHKRYLGRRYPAIVAASRNTYFNHTQDVYRRGELYAGHQQTV